MHNIVSDAEVAACVRKFIINLFPYYGMRIGNRNQAFELYHFQLPRVTFEGHFSTVVTLCVHLTRDLSVIAKFLVFF